MEKPPLAPKPKLVQTQRTGMYPAHPRRNVLPHPSPGTQKRVKPALAPKPILPKPASTVTRLLTSTSQIALSANTGTMGLLNSKNGVQQENKKPDWDYIIPICLCSQENCQCVVNSPTDNGRQVETKSKKPVADSSKNQNINATPQLPAATSARLSPYIRDSSTGTKQTESLSKSPNNDGRGTAAVTNRRPLPHRTQSDEVNGNCILSADVGQAPVAPALVVESTACPQEPLLPQEEASKPSGGEPLPVPVPWKPRKAALTRQEKMDEEPEERAGSGGREAHVREVTGPAARKNGWSASVGAPAPPGQHNSVISAQQQLCPSGRSGCPPPAPPPKKKPFLSTPAPPCPLPPDVDMDEEELDWGDAIYEMEISVDKEEEGEGNSESAHTPVPPSKSQPGPTSSNSSISAVEGDGSRLEPAAQSLKVPPKKPQRHSTPMDYTQTWESAVEAEEGTRSADQRKRDLSHSDDSLNGRATRRLPLPPAGKLRWSLASPPVAPAPSKPSRSAAGKQRAKSFTAVDVARTEGQKRHSFRKLLDLKLSVKMFPRLITKGGQGLRDLASTESEQSVEEDLGKDLEQDLERCGFRTRASPTQVAVGEQSVDGDDFNPDTGDDGMYENMPYYEEIPNYINVQAEVAHVEDGSSDEDDIIMAQSSDEEDDGSSSSSKDVLEPSDEKEDFREAVSRASQQAGKPVIEDRLLNQILYNLPQLYELNQDLLRELEQRVHKWDENARLADIFVKKGPYLKMYSTYIREFDKNVALLEEQCKRNPAFAAAVRVFEASPRCANLALRHYLLKPVQRIPQYQLLLTAALVIVKEVANHANDIMKQGDNFQKLIQVQCSLNGHHEIVQPGRVFLKEGVLKKLSRKIMQPRMFFLFNDTLLYTTPVQTGQFKLNNMLSLAGMKVSKPLHEAHQNELNIESVERSFILSASSATERDDWLQAISMAINDHTKKKISFIFSKSTEEMEDHERASGAPVGSKAPIWIPDPRATMCMICTCEFTLAWRRHHCRACGKVVCQACSSNKHCLEYLKNQLARVCDQCFPLLLQQQSSEKALSTTLSPSSRATFTFSRKHKRIPAALKEVSANTDHSSMSGYLQRSKVNKKQGRRLWFVIKDKVLYTYAASEDVAALESQPLLGFVLKEDSTQNLQFKLYHKNTIFYIFKADDVQAAQRWIASFKEATVL
ncbi:hypothetical protein CRUP_016680 [Coryphaenoides rupestris]|nr:hypothetical protein CRUP_016680 [Coryphaenoides rupestris]